MKPATAKRLKTNEEHAEVALASQSRVGKTKLAKRVRGLAAKVRAQIKKRKQQEVQRAGSAQEEDCWKSLQGPGLPSAVVTIVFDEMLCLDQRCDVLTWLGTSISLRSTPMQGAKEPLQERNIHLS